MAAAFGQYAGLPARYEALPVQVVGDNPDARAMLRWNAQTMSPGMGPAGLSLLQLWRPAPTTAAARAALDAGAVSAALSRVTQISALAYPGCSQATERIRVTRTEPRIVTSATKR
jgi:hypothetical protein